MEDNEQKTTLQLWKELLDIINKQIESRTQLKEIIEYFIGTSSKRKGTVLTEETVNKVPDLFVELEALHAEELALYHSLLTNRDNGNLETTH